MTITQIVPVLRVRDVMASIDWYHENFGFLADPFPDLPPFEFAILRLGRHEIMLQRGEPIAESPPKPYRWNVYIRLSEEPLRELHTKFASAGIVSRRLERMFYGLAEFEISDPDGYVICFGQFLEDADNLPSPEA
jgi:uncharacterized glyoxalase superfamily protein PhnB